MTATSTRDQRRTADGPPGARPPYRFARDPGPLLPDPSVRVASLDGLRAIAVLAVLVYHVAPDRMPGGFLGVSLFFTLSGFLITRLLLAEHEAQGGVDLRRFWRRRYRRLMPASLVTLAAVAAVWTAAGWMTRAVAGDVVASLAQVANWRFLVTGTEYGQQIDASPVLHFWSLAIEEQFYLAFPVLVWLVARGRARPARAIGLLAVVGITGSALATAAAGGDELTVYFSTFTRAGEVLVGALLATATWRLRAPLRRTPVAVAGALALAALLALAATSALVDPWWASGGLLAVSVLSAAAMLGASQPGPLRRALEVAPLVRLGEISYGVYLLHWPILQALRTTDLPSTVVAAIVVAGSIALAAVSFRWLERPVKEGRWRLRPALVAVPTAAAIVAVALWGGARDTTPTFAFTPELGVAGSGAEPAVPRTAPPPSAPADPAGALGADTPAPEAGAVPLEGPVAVSVFGDSTAIQLRLALTGADPRIEVRPGWSDIGCPLSRGGTVRDQGRTFELDRCDWTDRWPGTLAQVGSQVALVYGGSWDLVERRYPERWDGWRTIEDPAVAEHVGAELVALVDALREGGASRVVLLTLAPNADVGTEENERRTEAFNRVLREAAAERPDVARVVDLAGWFATQPAELRPDGVHVTEATGRTVVEAWLADQLLAAAR